MLVFCASLSSVARAEGYEVVFPDGLTVEHGFANVRDYGAVGDGVADDTQAFVKAMRAFDYTHHRLVYVPDGTYLLSDTIDGRIKGGKWMSRLHIVGQSRERTIVRLKDDAPGFGGPAKPKPMFRTGSHKPWSKAGEGNTAFRNSILNLTLDLGAGNPGAVGVDYLASNTGSLRDVTIRAAEGSGYCGIQMERKLPGPALIKNVSVQGCDYGLRIATDHYSMTVDHVAFRGQRVCAVRNHGNQIHMRRVTSDNAVPFYVAAGRGARLVLCDSKLWGGSDAIDAVVLNGGLAYLRNVKAAGYKAVVAGQGKHVEEWYTGEAVETFNSPDRALGLPVKEIPEPQYPADPSLWANVLDYGATQSPPPSSGDDTEALQKAIDSGKPYVLVPNRKYHVTDQVVVRGKVRMIFAIGGCSILMMGEKQGTPPLRIDETESDTVELVGLFGGSGRWGQPWVVGNTSKTIVFRRGQPAYTNTENATGGVFLEDCGGSLRLEHPQNVWAVQLDAEFARPLVQMERGGRIWVFSMKTEMGIGKGKMKYVGHRKVIENHGGSLEILGFYMRFLDPIPKTWKDIGPFAVNDRGRMSVAVLHWYGPRYPITVKERRGDEWRSSRFGSTPLYTGYRGEGGD
jgi:hypothetical protein